MLHILKFFARDDFGWLVAAKYGNFLDFFNPNLETWFYRPVSQELYFWLNYKIWHFNALGFHLTTIFLHFISAFLVYLIVKKLLNKKVALLTSVLWGLNTIHYLSVLWVSGFTMSGAVLFNLTAFYLYIQNKKAISVVFFFLALLSNESAYLFPFVIFAYEYLCVQKDLSLRLNRVIKNFKKPLISSFPFIILNLFMLGVYFLFIDLPNGEYGLTLNAVANVKTFFKYLLYPLVTSFDRDYIFGLINILLALRFALLFIPLPFVAKRPAFVGRLKSIQVNKALFFTFWMLIFYSLFTFLPHHTYAYDSSPGSIGFFAVISYLVLQNKFVKNNFKYFVSLVLVIQILILSLAPKTDPDFLWLQEYSVGGKEWLEIRSNSEVPEVKTMNAEEIEYSYYGNMYKFCFD